MHERNQQFNIGNFLNTEKELIRAIDLANHLGLSKETIYDWKYRSKKKEIPAGMFIKIGKMLFIRTSILKIWLNSRTVEF